MTTGSSHYFQMWQKLRAQDLYDFLEILGGLSYTHLQPWFEADELIASALQLIIAIHSEGEGRLLCEERDCQDVKICLQSHRYLFTWSKCFAVTQSTLARLVQQHLCSQLSLEPKIDKMSSDWNYWRWINMQRM
jgi:hypothetical protein